MNSLVPFYDKVSKELRQAFLKATDYASTKNIDLISPDFVLYYLPYSYDKSFFSIPSLVNRFEIYKALLERNDFSTPLVESKEFVPFNSDLARIIVKMCDTREEMTCDLFAKSYIDYYGL